MSSLLYEIINEANLGEIVIDGDSFQVAFNTVIFENGEEIYSNLENNNYPVLVINDREIFLSKLNEYIGLCINKGVRVPNFSKDIERNKVKLMVSYIFANATTEDFINPIALLDRNIQFLKDDTFAYLDDDFYTNELGCFQNSSIKIKNTVQSVFMETPNRINISFTKNIQQTTVEHFLPSISYGIAEDSGGKVCYIYSILQPKITKKANEIQERYDKKISREMYKINAGIADIENIDYKNYNDQDTYYPENISDVSPSAVLSLVVFLALLSRQGITKIKVVPYLPIRFLARDLSIGNIDNKVKIDEMQQRNTNIQKNITDKFIRTFRRVSYHFEKFNINYYPYEINEFMGISLANFDSHFNNEILQDVYMKTLKSIVEIKKR
jgi:hypothetical protein